MSIIIVELDLTDVMLYGADEAFRRAARPAIIRSMMLWRLRDLFLQVLRQRVWWASQEPSKFGGYWE